MRKNERLMYVMIAVLAGFAFGCGDSNPPTAPSQAMPTQMTKTQSSSDVPSALPNNAFKAQITFVEPPAKLRAGQKETIHIKIKNASDAIWWARGAQVNTRGDNKFYIAAGNRWLKADGSLLTNMDGRYGIGKDLKPGEETEVPLAITAPKDPGEYTLEIDLVQEQVAWFSEKGSPTAKTKVTVTK